MEGAEPGTAYVGLGGLESLYGGEARLLPTLLNVVSQDPESDLGLMQVGPTTASGGKRNGHRLGGTSSARKRRSMSPARQPTSQDRSGRGGHDMKHR